MAQVIFTSFFILLTLLLGVSEVQCGRQAGGALCAGGNTDSYCGDGFQDRRGGGGRVGDVGSIITSDIFEEMLKYRNNIRCHAKGFYTYDAFISAANAFPDFGIAGDDETRKREIAAFFGQTSFETTGGASKYWGYCYVNSTTPSDNCANSTRYPCAPGKEYYGRGPMQLSWNYNYGPCGEAIGEDLLHNPDLVATDPVVSFKSAIWFWMTAQSPKPSCHDVMTGRWLPSDGDISAGRNPGYGLTTNIINGSNECGQGVHPNGVKRIEYYTRYCGMLGIGDGDKLDCYNQSPFGYGLVELVKSMLFKWI